jgi:hypothetical protein
MKTHTLLASAAMMILGTNLASALEPFIYVDIDFKVLVSSTGRMSGVAADSSTHSFSATVGNQRADTFISALNDTFMKMGRGLRARRKRDVQSVVNGNGDAQPQTDIYFPCTWNIMLSGVFTPTVKSSPTEWKYLTSACNVYIFDGYRDDLDKSLPPPSQGYFAGGIGYAVANIIVCSGLGADPMVHEFAHWLDLQHTFLDGSVPVAGPPLWKDDGFSDTLEDSGAPFRTLDDLAKEDYGFQATYAARSSEEQTTLQTRFREYYAQQIGATSAATFADLSTLQRNRINDWLNHNLNKTLGSPFIRASAQTDAVADLIAARNFPNASGSRPFYDEVTNDQRAKIESLLANIESYHSGKSSPVSSGAFTAQQLDHMADRLRELNPTTASGKFIFVGAADTPTDTGKPLGGSKNPHPASISGLAAAQSQLNASTGKMDIVLLAPGAYPGSVTLNVKGTYRARTTTNPNTFELEQKHVTIGSSTPH